MIDITITPAEGGAALVTVGPFTDQDTPANEITPDTLVWTLSSTAGVVINNREYVELTPDATVEFLISGDDLAYPGAGKKLLLTIDATYTSTIDGETVEAIPLREQAKFSVEKFVIVRPE